MIYPKHIYDPLRIELAEQLLEKELAKLFPDVGPDMLAAQISKWRTDPHTFHLEEGIRDFWNIFASVFESIKLKPRMTTFLTAKNITWSKQTIPVGNIQLSSQLTQIKRLPVAWDESTTVADVIRAIPDKAELNEQRRINDEHSSQAQTDYPILVLQDSLGNQKVMDGNRRCLRAGLYEQAEINAWIGKMEDEAPQDYWVPVSELMNIVKIYRLATTDTEKLHVRNTLELLFRSSGIARLTYDTRVGNQNNKWANELIAIEPSL